MTDEMTRGIIAFGIEEARNSGLEEAARILDRRAGVFEQSRYPQDAMELRQLAVIIRGRKTSAHSKLAEAKVACGNIAGLLPAPHAAL